MVCHVISNVRYHAHSYVICHVIQDTILCYAHHMASTTINDALEVSLLTASAMLQRWVIVVCCLQQAQRFLFLN